MTDDRDSAMNAPLPDDAGMTGNVRGRRFGNVVSVAIFGGVNVLNRGMTTILALIFALRLSPAELGVYAVVIGIAEVAGILSDAGLSQAMIRNYFDRHADEDSHRYIAEVMFTARLVGLGLLAVIGVVLALLWPWVTGGTAPLWPYLPMALGLSFFNRIGLMVNSLCQALQRPVEYGLFNLVQAVALGGTVLLFVFVLDWGTVGAVSALLGALVIANTVRMVIMARLLQPSFRLLDRAALADLFGYGIPLLPKQLAIWGRQMALRLVLVNLVSVSALGNFFFASSLASTLAMVTTALEPAFTPQYMKRRIQGAPDFQLRVKRFLMIVLGLLVPLYAAGILFSASGTALFASQKFGGAIALLPVLFLNLFFQTQEPFMTKQLVFQRRTGTASALTIIPIALALATLPAVVPALGLIGVAWVMVIANVVVLILVQLAVTRIEPSDFPAKTSAAAGAGLILLTIFSQVYGLGLDNRVELLVRAAVLLAIVAGSLALLVWPNWPLLKRLLAR